jgi:ubiquinone/menaquinone biosynthesis C-methylase UbiE
MTASLDAKRGFFDSIAEQWDGWDDLDRLAGNLDAGLAAMGLSADETVLDVGCGTGNLTRALLRRLSTAGRILAVDIAPRMLAVARGKVADGRVGWLQADAERLPLADGLADRVVCFSVWPHFERADAVARELRRVLRPGGSLHIWHLCSRREVNQIHATVNEAVHHDRLVSAAETAAVLEGQDLAVQVTVDDDRRYLVHARRRP